MNSLTVQWLGVRAFIPEGPGSIFGWGTKPPTNCSTLPPKKEETRALSLSAVRTQQEVCIQGESYHQTLTVLSP